MNPLKVNHSDKFGRSYYTANHQDQDRPALQFYTRLAKKYFKSGRVLDFGCGTGYFMRRLGRFFNVDGFEVSAHGVAHSRNLLPHARILTVLDDIPRGIYSGIMALHVLEHIPDEELAFVCAAWRKALLPGGKILCVMPEREGLGHRIKGQDWIGFKDPTHINLKSRSEWLELLEIHGLTAVAAGTDGLWDFPYSPHLPRFVDLVQHAPGTVVQFLFGRLLLKAGNGESLILVLEPAIPEGTVRC